MTEIQKRLSALADRKNAEFQAKLTPNVDCDKFIGVRTPQLRILAASLSEKERTEFMEALPHEFYDENMLYSVILEKWKDYGECLEKVERFLPYVDNWAVCDTLRPKVFAGHREELLPHVKRWIASDMVYTCRFGINMLMTCAMPRMTSCIESVTTNGNILNFEMRTPFTRPRAVVTARVSRQAGITPQPRFMTNSPRRTAASASCEPTVRSMPPAVITRHIPNAIEPFIATCFATFIRFLPLRKLGSAMLRHTSMMKRITPIPYFPIKRRNESDSKKLLFDLSFAPIVPSCY